MVWYSYLLKNFSQFVVIYTVKGFGRVNKAEVDVFLEVSYFFDDPTDISNLFSGFSVFSIQLVRMGKIKKTDNSELIKI